jgi:2-aminoadipate transaminase
VGHNTFDFAAAVRSDVPPAVDSWQGFAQYNFINGNNAPESIPVVELVAAVTSVLEREGRTLATYGLESGPQGYRPLREFLAGKLHRQAGIDCTPDNILLTSGSLQGIDLVNQVLLSRGDTVIIEEATYGGCLSRFQRLGVTATGVPLDSDGMRVDALAEILADLKQRGTKPKFIYTIPTIQNPTASIMTTERRRQLLALAADHDIPIVEDECYSDLIWDGQRPPAIYSLDDSARVIFLGSFSKSIAPALRVGYIVAPWALLSRVLACKTDAGSGALEQMVLAEYCTRHFDTHVVALNKTLKEKLDALMDALAEYFGAAAEFEAPKGGIFLWVKLPAEVDTTKLAQKAAEAGIAINPGAEWSVADADGRRSLRICYANPPVATIRQGVAALAEVCNREFGVPSRIANVQRS